MCESILDSPLGVMDVLVVLVHQADLELQALHHNLEVPAVPENQRKFRLEIIS